MTDLNARIDRALTLVQMLCALVVTVLVIAAALAPDLAIPLILTAAVTCALGALATVGLDYADDH
jgi:multisubunit Na+/H+ antiporter MnhB subunit